VSHLCIIFGVTLQVHYAQCHDALLLRLAGSPLREAIARQEARHLTRTTPLPHRRIVHATCNGWRLQASCATTS